MMATLNLVDHLLAMGRRYQELGRQRDALAVLTRLSGFRELPAEAAEETQVRLAELHLRRRRYARARRHLTAALGHQPDNARYHYLMAGSLHADERADGERAAAHYRRSLELDPGQVRCRADYGLLLVRLGQVEEGQENLRQAFERAPDNVEVVARLVKALRLTGRSAEARLVVRAALFRNPKSPRFRKLWGDFQYQELRRHQQAERLRGEAGEGAEDGPVLLPFVQPAQDTPPAAGCPTILRPDEAGPLSSPKTPLLGRSRRRPDQRHVQ